MTFIFSFVSINAEPTSPILDKIITAKVLRVGTTGDFTPFSYINEAGLDRFSGIDIDLAEDLAKVLDVKVRFIHTTWPTLMEDLLADKFDIGMSGISITAERAEVAMFSIPLLSGGKVAITRDENVEKFRTLDQINQPNVRIIVNPGGTNEKFARANFPDAELIVSVDNITIFKKIINGDADVMVTDRIETIMQQAINPKLEAVNPDNPFNRTQKGYIFKQDIAFKAYIDNWLNSRLTDGTFHKIFDNQIGKHTKTQP